MQSQEERKGHGGWLGTMMELSRSYGMESGEDQGVVS